MCLLGLLGFPAGEGVREESTVRGSMAKRVEDAEKEGRGQGKMKICSKKAFAFYSKNFYPTWTCEKFFAARIFVVQIQNHAIFGANHAVF